MTELFRDDMKTYAIRFSVEKWDKPAEIAGSTLIRNGVRVSANDFGYTDRLFLFSIVQTHDGCNSIMLMDSEEGETPSRETLLMIREAIDHHIEFHT